MNIQNLDSNEREALRCFVAYLQNNVSEELVAIALFGSKARGDSGPESDLDILVVTKEDDGNLRREIQIQAARISLKFDLLLSPRVIGLPRWEKLRGFSLYLNVIRDSTGLNIQDEQLVLEPASLP